MLKGHEILGTDKPILRERESNHFFLDEITQLNENPEHYEVAGYVQMTINKQIFYKPVYVKKG
ncbi:hypothetical protein [Heyndrickxia sporothermodurans]|uniref:Uncharacterized protein n=1 Tax=Heyndrickxia sporothermodurans TaxID=46224 RepID=A0AB37HGQ6_9BACI|nr:hypothetical protein [Heyndrickxia sporothermodurans]MBL5768667.1 hypothetical protein [Heyndrickxia sporothermodurans]MBL5772385.1 hypothetical protein [Heyndrickxia sporothermodurans]MBL5775922.1 hypothetical protein [Heyndrickxia sporothermodurans]MBL5779808.1 hypothetical protein [Heyndrickxia sporothermodurans]MBL5782807.1 hypothetical protein [Heyndrickxia sporothermodurans]